jgi:hypothetical protein
MVCAAVASMRDSANEPVAKMLPADIRAVSSWRKDFRPDAMNESHAYKMFVFYCGVGTFFPTHI